MKTVSIKDLERIQSSKGFVRREKEGKYFEKYIKELNQANNGLLAEIATLKKWHISGVNHMVEAIKKSIPVQAEQKKKKFKFDIKRDKWGRINTIDVNEI